MKVEGIRVIVVTFGRGDDVFYILRGDDVFCILSSRSEGLAVAAADAALRVRTAWSDQTGMVRGEGGGQTH